jgi:hypothetical protein
MAATRVAVRPPAAEGFLNRTDAPNDRLANITTPGDPDMAGWLDYFVTTASIRGAAPRAGSIGSAASSRGPKPTGIGSIS